VTFPVSVAGSISLPIDRSQPIRHEEFLSLIEAILDSKNANDVRRDGDTIWFRLPFLNRGWSWDIMIPYDSGRFDVDYGPNAIIVRYDLRVVRMLAITTTIAVVVGLLALNAPVAVFAWAWLFGMNYVIAVVRMPGWLRRNLCADRR
jgi:hypothetical protein